MPQSNRSLLEVHNLSCWRGQRLLFQHLSFQLERGQVLGLKGRNGAGKSSLLVILAGLLRSGTGHITYKGLPLTQQDVCWLGPRAPFYAHLSLRDNLLFWGALNNFPTICVEEALSRYHLSAQANQAVATLSRGQLQRAHLCRLRLSHASIWLLDEPTAGLDEAGQEILGQEIRSFQEQGGRVIVAPHMSDWTDNFLNIEHYHPTKMERESI